MKISPVVAAAHKASMKRMLAIEGAARTMLGAAVRQAILSAPGHLLLFRAPKTHLIAITVSHRVEIAVTVEIHRARRAARRESLAGLHEEAAAAGPPLPLELTPSVSEDEDQARATMAAKAFAAAWLREMLDGDGIEGEVAPQDVVPDMMSAANAQGYRLDTIAATEVANAFNDERELVTDDYAERARLRFLPIPLKRWDATLDGRTCRVCAKLHGSLVPWGFDFPGGEVPGDVHPRCRCVETTLFLPLPYEQTEAA